MYAGGTFTRIGGQPRPQGLAVLDAATDEATTWNPKPGSGVVWAGSVYAVAVGGDKVYVGGEVTGIGGKARAYIAAVGK